MKHRLTKLFILVLLGLSVFLVWAFSGKFFIDREALLAEAQLKVKAGDLDGAEEQLQPLLRGEDVSPELLLFAAEINRYQGDFGTALEYLDRIGPSHSEFSRKALVYRAEANMRLGHLSAAVDLYQQVLDADPGNSGARRQLIFVLNISGLSRMGLSHMLKLVYEGQFDPELLLSLCDLDRPHRNESLIQTALETSPHDPLVLLAAGKLAELEGDQQTARLRFEAAIEQDAEFVPAYLALGKLLLSSREHRKFLKLMNSTPQDAEREVDYWILLGEWSRLQSMSEAGIRCYWEAARRTPDHIEAHFQLGQLLLQQNRTDDARRLLDWSEQLAHLSAIVQAINQQTPQSESSRNVSRQLARLNRYGEAWAWASIAQRIEPDSQESGLLLTEIEKKLTPAVPTNFPQSPAAALDFSHFPIPDLEFSEPGPAVPDGDRIAHSSSAIRFEDVSASAGLEFTYQNAADAKTEGRRLFEFTGGGVAAFDYDLDGWPDLYLTQGGERSPEQGLSSVSDQLFRNRQGTRYVDVTGEAGIEELHFSQGIAVGDIDSDGFPDVYVANIGRNQLWRNNGDGTLSDITEESGIDQDRWTTSCGIADLNGDGFPELFDVNYLEGPNLLSLICESKGKPRVCAPTAFSPSQDAVWSNRGTGEFKLATQSSGLSTAQGNGLGLLIADFDRDQKPDLFVANDAVSNHYWTNQSTESLRLEESAVLSGLAVNSAGRAEACMGVAAGDADRDGRIDLFVTNFFQESNTLYMQQGAHLFEDRTERFGLSSPGYRLLGFGTQFLDAELDGWEDLIVLNGDIDDFSHLNREERMPPIFLRNQEGQKFHQLEAKKAGSFFGQKRLGRALATLDWNRDGRTDFVAAFLESPTQLVENRTQHNHHWLSLKLVGTLSSRDAVGAQITVKAADRSLTAQVTAGDGYQCHNEKKLNFGLGNAAKADVVEISWPSGLRQQYLSLESNGEYVCIEGDPQARRMPVERMPVE